MRQVIIENPVLNSPFDEPSRHFRFDEEGITDDIIEERRISSYFLPIAQPRRRGNQQLPFDTEWTKDRIEENKAVNRIRQRVGLWREGGYLGVTPTTSKLFEYWTKPERERKLFFCQIEALETAIYIAEVAKKYGDPLDREPASRGERPVQTPVYPGWLSRWRPARARRLSWRCSLPGRR
jgi:type III restriction enzyme